LSVGIAEEATVGKPQDAIQAMPLFVRESLEKLGAKFVARGSTASFSPDGQRLVYSTPGSGLRVSAPGEQPVDLVAEGKDPAWCPTDETKIAFVRDGGEGETVWLFDSSTNETVRVAEGGYPSWSADGRTLFFHSRKLGNLQRATWRDDGRSSVEPIMSLSWHDHPAVSPDGTKVTYLRNDDVFIADVPSGRVLVQMSWGADSLLPSWSCDSKMVALSSSGSGVAPGIWILNLELQRVSSLVLESYTRIGWSIDGQKIVFERGKDEPLLWEAPIPADLDFASSIDTAAANFRRRGQLVSAVSSLSEQLVNEFQAGNVTKALDAAKPLVDKSRELYGERHPAYANCLRDLARLHWLQGDLTRAEALYTEAVEIGRQTLGERDADFTLTLTNLGVFYESIGNYSNAERLLRQAMEIRKEVLGERHPEYAASLNNLGFLYDSMGEYARAEPFLRDAIELLREIVGDRHPDYASSLNNLASVYQKLGQYAKAEPLFQEALKIRKQIFGERHVSYAEILNNLALLYRLKGDYTKAEPLYLEALEIRKEALGQRDPLYAQSLNNLGVLYDSMGEYRRAEPLYKEALAIRKEVLGEGHPAYATSLNNLAVMYRSTGQYAKAEPLYQQAVELHKAVLGEAHPVYAQSLNNLAGLYQSIAEHERAEPLYRKALEIRKQTLGEHHPQYADSLFVLAELYWSMGDAGRAEPMFHKCMEILEESVGENHSNYGVCLNNLGLIYLSAGEYTKAEGQFQRALETTAKSLGERHPSYAVGLSNLAGVYWSMGDGDRAEPLFRQALEISQSALGERHPGSASTLNNLAALYESRGEIARAEPLYRQAMEIAKESLGERHPAYAATLSNLAFLYQSIGDNARAEQLCREAAGIAVQSVEETLSIGSEHQLLRLAAENQARVEHWISMVTESQTDDITRLQDLLLRWKGLVAASRFERSARAESDPEIANRMEELQQVRQQLATIAFAIPPPGQIDVWRRRIDSVRQRKDTLESELAHLSREIREEFKLRQLTGEDLADILPDNACLIDMLEYAHVWPTTDRKGDRKSENRVIAFIVHPGEAGVLVQLGASDAIHQAISEWRQAVAEIDARKLERAGQRLAALVWQPIERHLGNARHIFVSPDGMLAQLPVAALPGSREDSYVLEEYAVSYVASAHDLARLLQHKSSPDAVGGGFLAIGDVDYETLSEDGDASGDVFELRSFDIGHLARAGFLPLPGTQLEIERCRALYESVYADARVDALTRGDASETRVKHALTSECQVVHLATHGFFESPEHLRNQLRAARQAEGPAAPTATMEHLRDVAALVPLLKSGIVLAGAAARRPEFSIAQLVSGEIPDNGILTAEEVASLDMKGTELVTLSACDTGLGELTAGQGVMGLQRAFHRAGVRTVVSSLWKVDDAATTVLMEEFYTNLWIKKMSKHEALRQAQITILNHPERINERRVLLNEELTLRGLSGQIKPLPSGGKRSATATEPQRSHPANWAAFVLSGSPD
jgi:tetratricopeptide (TPR) repeat protein